jgi:hypothetical protein
MLDVDVKIAIHRSNENKKKYIGPMEIKKIHRSNENGKNYIAVMKMKNYTTIETLVCIVVLTVLPHLIRYLLPQINHESVLTCLAR